MKGRVPANKATVHGRGKGTMVRGRKHGRGAPARKRT